jgi:hypothetical protein
VCSAAGFARVCSGESGHARIEIPDVPCLAHDSVVGSLRELKGPLVIDLTGREWPRVMV